eukprot:tig00000989_g6119.t1
MDTAAAAEPARAEPGSTLELAEAELEATLGRLGSAAKRRRQEEESLAEAALRTLQEETSNASCVRPAAAEPASPFDLLPDDLIQRVFVMLGAEDAFESGVGQVSRRFQRLLYSVAWPSLKICAELFGREKKSGPQGGAEGTEAPAERCVYAGADMDAAQAAGAACSCRWKPVLWNWTERLLSEQLLSANRLEVLLLTPDDDEFESGPDEFAADDLPQRSVEFARAFAHFVPELGGLLAAAARAFPSLSSVSVTIYGKTSPEYVERALASWEPAMRFEHMLEDAAVALFPCTGLQELELCTALASRRWLPTASISLPPARLASLLGPLSPALRVLDLPRSCTLSAEHVQALVESLPALANLGLSIAFGHARGALQHIASLGALQELYCHTPAAAEDVAAGLAALAAGPAATSLRELHLGWAKALSAAALAAVARLEGLAGLSLAVRPRPGARAPRALVDPRLQVDGSSAPGVPHLAALTRVRPTPAPPRPGCAPERGRGARCGQLRELHVRVRLARRSTEGVAAACRALAALVRRLLPAAALSKARAPRPAPPRPVFPALTRGQICLLPAPQLDLPDGPDADPAAYCAFEPDAFAELVAASRPALVAVLYETYVDRGPSRREVEALLACPRLRKLELRHVVRHTADLHPYSLWVQGGRARLRPGLPVSIALAVPDDDREILGDRCLALLDSWLPACDKAWVAARI